jgi:uridine kinase
MSLKPTLIGVSGGSGSGKTTLVNRLTNQFVSPSDLMVIQMDHYYRDLSHLSQADRDKRNFDHPDSLDLELLQTHLESLAKGNTVERPSYDFASHTRLQRTTTLTPAPVIIIDGILALHHPGIRNLLALSIYVDVDDDLRFIRRLRRDISERGRTVDSVISQYLATVKAMHDSYVEPQKYVADIIVSWRDYNDRAVRMLSDMIRGLNR